MKLNPKVWIVGSVIILAAVSSILGFKVFRRINLSSEESRLISRMQRSLMRPHIEHPEQPSIIGHRGVGLLGQSRAKMIGNTANAIREAIAANVDWIEVDIRASKDEHLILYHDPRIGGYKTTGFGRVKDLELGHLQSESVLVSPPETILSLDQMMSLFHDLDRRWIFDVKTAGISQSLKDAIDRYALGDDQLILFGNYNSLKEYKDFGLPLGYTVLASEYRNFYRALFNRNEIFRRCDALEVSYLVLPRIFASKSMVNAALARGLFVWVYGSNNVSDLEYLVKLGVSGIIVDEPNELMEYFVYDSMDSK